MTPDQIEQAARHLLGARQAGSPGPRLPEPLRPSQLASAFAIQCKVSALLGQAIGGWKCSLPSTGKIVVAPIYQPTIHTGSPVPVQAVGGVVKIEPEIGLVLKQDLAPRNAPYRQEELATAIGEVRLVLELIGCRYAEPQQAGFAEHLADGLFNQGLLLGPKVGAGLDGAFAAFEIELARADGEQQRYQGVHPDGGPLAPALWLANFLSGHGIALKAGQTIITGSYAGAIEVPLQTELTLRFGAFGSLVVQLAER